MVTSSKQKSLFSFLLFLLTFLLFFSCQSLQQDLLVSSADETADSDIAELEERIVALDLGHSRDVLASIREKITSLEGRAVQDAVFQARLAAWSGRLYLFENRPGEAQKQLNLSRQLVPGNIQALVLTARMENDVQKRLAFLEDALELDPATGELRIELGRALFELKRYREAAAAFDAAFTRLTPEIYEKTYRDLRNQAWELKEVSPQAGGRVAELVQKQDLTWGEAIELVGAETGLLRFLTGGRNWTAGELFPRLLDRNFIPMTQDIYRTAWPSRNPVMGDQMLRSGAAWFLWQLNAENRADKSLLTRYSSRYKSRGQIASPIPDLPVESPFLDAIMGCVEWEIMALPDGKNFVPWEAVKGIQFLEMLKKIER